MLILSNGVQTESGVFKDFSKLSFSFDLNEWLKDKQELETVKPEINSENIDCSRGGFIYHVVDGHILNVVYDPAGTNEEKVVATLKKVIGPEKASCLSIVSRPVNIYGKLGCQLLFIGRLFTIDDFDFNEVDAVTYMNAISEPGVTFFKTRYKNIVTAKPYRYNGINPYNVIDIIFTPEMSSSNDKRMTEENFLKNHILCSAINSTDAVEVESDKSAFDIILDLKEDANTYIAGKIEDGKYMIFNSESYVLNNKEIEDRINKFYQGKRYIVKYESEDGIDWGYLADDPTIDIK